MVPHHAPPCLLSRLLAKTPQIWLKREELAHTGAHKINNAVGQALLAKRIGKNRIIAETGAGQHGVATATVCALLGMECIIYMGAVDCERQKLNVFRMKMLGAKVGGWVCACVVMIALVRYGISRGDVTTVL